MEPRPWARSRFHTPEDGAGVVLAFPIAHAPATTGRLRRRAELGPSVAVETMTLTFCELAGISGGRMVAGFVPKAISRVGSDRENHM